MEALCREDLNKRELKIILYIIRRTYGWGEKLRVVSLSDIVSATRIDKAHVSRTVREMGPSGRGILKFSSTSKRKIGINKRYKQWRGVAKTATAKPCEGGCQNSNKRVAETATQGLPKQQPLYVKESLKERKKDTTATNAAVNMMEIELKDGTMYIPTSLQIQQWQDTYKQINVDAELRKMRQWCIDNPTKRKTRQGVTRFINGWLNRSLQQATAKKERGTKLSRALNSIEQFNESEAKQVTHDDTSRSDHKRIGSHVDAQPGKYTRRR